MVIEFRRETFQTRFLDPSANFSEATRSFEVRTDPLTQKTSYIFGVRGATVNKLDLSSIIQRSLDRGCPFCPQAIDTTAPKFIPELFPQGRIEVGEAYLFPNIMPYIQHSALCVLSSQHFIALPDFTQEMLTNALIASQTYLKRVHEYDARARYLRIGWNYMPPSGSSQPHPHLQVEASYLPTPYEREIMEASQQYYITNGTNFWSDLITKEQQLGERYIGDTGSICWLVPFAPKGKLLDILAIFKHRDFFLDTSEQEFRDFSAGLVRVFHYMSDQNIYSFNLSIISAITRNDHFWMQARIVPRMTATELDVSDCHYYDVLHDQNSSVGSPEDNCQELKKYFEDNAISH